MNLGTEDVNLDEVVSGLSVTDFVDSRTVDVDELGLPRPVWTLDVVPDWVVWTEFEEVVVTEPSACPV